VTSCSSHNKFCCWKVSSYLFYSSFLRKHGMRNAVVAWSDTCNDRLQVLSDDY
jgi:hypothetical protein